MIKFSLKNFLLVLFTSFFVIGSGCGLLGGNDENTAPSINWEQGELIEPGDEDELSQEKLNSYRVDAERLAVRFIRNQDSTETDIPQPLIDHLYNGLIHIGTSGKDKAQQATDEYNIHARVPSHPRQIEVWTDTTASWLEAWESGQTQTGNSEVDDLTDQFNFALTNYEALEDTVLSKALLTSDGAINGYAVGRMAEELAKIENAGPSPVHDGDEINVLFFNDRLRYFLEHRSGDCTSDSGCSSVHTWVFDVYKDGTVSFIGEQGDPL